ncbi:hypothetical protein L6452_06952 [Arctium lappa]|uniref:Uncharacterized protein n=1 Tax=Arctium lappa TaxID=4217 RepID=A0ACB9EKL0_ARCLA|nr:hypothetical protein L6452_06952 [Arctium lappa]
MDSPDLENIPPDLAEIFLENRKIVDAPVEFDSEVMIGSGNSFDGVNLSGKTSKSKVKEGSLIKEVLSSSLGSNVKSPISNSIRKSTPRKFSMKGAKLGAKEVESVINFVKSGFGNRIVKVSGVTGVKQKMEVDAMTDLAECLLWSGNVDFRKQNGGSDEKSVNIPVGKMENANSSMEHGVVNGEQGVNQKQPTVMIGTQSEMQSSSVNINVDTQADHGIGQRPKSVNNVSDKCFIVSDGMIGNKSGTDSVDINIPVDLVIGQRLKSDLQIADENNRAILSKIGMNNMESRGIGASGRGDHFFSFGNGTGAINNAKSDLKLANDNNNEIFSKIGMDNPGFFSFGRDVFTGRGGDKVIGSSSSGKGEHNFSFGSGTGAANEKGVVDTVKNNIPEVVMAESGEILTEKGIGAVKKNVNAWSSKGVTLADKIKGNTDNKIVLKYKAPIKLDDGRMAIRFSKEGVGIDDCM